jgi:RNA polymerase sigma factor (sigma-70 family)
MTDDAELLRRYAADRSEDAFSELVQRHVDLVYSTALRQTFGDHHRAEEVTQMVFVDLARKAAALVRHPVLPAWLHRSSHLAALEIRRKEGRRLRYERAAAAESLIGAQDGQTVAWDQVGPVLDEALNRLGERDRQAILLRYFAHRPFVEVGARLKLSENAARMRVERALNKLHALLTQRGIRSSSAALAAALSGHAIAAAPAGVAAASASAAMAAGGTALAWIAFMSTAKLPAALTVAVLLGGATVVALQNPATVGSEAAEISWQKQEISRLRVQNRGLSLAAGHARELEDDAADIGILQKQVMDLESKADDRRALAAGRLKANRGAPPDSSLPSETANAKSVLPPRVLTQFRPEYPAEMQSSGTSGEVLVDLIVDKDGNVQNAFAAHSSDRAFEEPAVRAVSQWAFQPGEANGHPVSTHLQIPVVFTSSSEPAPPTAGTWF